MSKSSFGIIGLGVMGKSLSLNALNNDISLSVYNRSEGQEAHVVEKFLDENKGKSVQGFTELPKFVDSLEQPRKILLMVKAGETIDIVINAITPHLAPEDIIMDGGNSHFEDTKRRGENLMMEGIHYLGVGISGGESGARTGPSIMPGGSKEAYDTVSSILKSLAAKSAGQVCCDYIGPGGSGHFVKMVHNGIEYVEMQLIGEIVSLLRPSFSLESIAEVFESWSAHGQSGYLLDITINILRKKEGDKHLLDLILDKAENKGTGSWSSKAAFDLGSTNTLMAEAVFARYISSLKNDRVAISSGVKVKANENIKIDLKALSNAYEFARIINHIQGFELLRRASSKYIWGLKLASIANIWRDGCIIKSELMERLASLLKQQSKLYKNKELQQLLTSYETDVNSILIEGVHSRKHIPTLLAAQQYWVALTTANLPANVIQAQRDYFGSHTYQRTDASSDQYFHTDW